MQKFSKIILVFIFFFIGIFTISKVFALEVNWPTSPFGTDLTVDSKLPDMVKYFYEWGIAIGGIAVFISLLFGGFLYLTSAGDPGRLREAKDRIFSALTGLALLLGSWLILNTINPELTVLRPPTFEKPVVGVDLSALEAATEKKSCDFAILYDQTYWKGNATSICASENPPTVDVSGWGTPRSVRFFRACDQNEYCGGEGKIHILTTSTVATTVDSTVTTTEIQIDTPTPILCINTTSTCATSTCFKEGGSCTLEFYTRGTILWVIPAGCGDKIGNTSASLHNARLGIQTDASIVCVRLSKTGFED